MGHVLIGGALMVLTTFVHAVAMAIAIRLLKIGRADGWVHKSIWIQPFVIAALVLIMFVASLIEAGLWAAAFMIAGAFNDFESALYFSMVTYTTLGYGDVLLGEEWRLLASFGAANGIIMFGWTTAIICAAVHAVYLARKAERADP